MDEFVARCERFMRLVSMVFSAIGAALVGLAAETKTVFFVQRRAGYRDLHVLWLFTVISSVSSAYNILQLFRGFICASLREHRSQRNKKLSAWVHLVLDQGVAYVMFAVTVAAIQGSMVGLTGVKQLQWSKLCNIYTRFCYQIAAGVLCGLVASMAMAFVSSITVRHLFLLYPAFTRAALSNSKSRWNIFYSSLN
ncbi:hypothetical protein HPP92_013012 [Vanilla planifolia]|uniref:CASP-like protein n=1 Tax=Vanilla planifolia TaxID=51239 RepID=A0A835R1L2_VANPL|nr:hypothetical protein HPP92_013012 [Vanilla planifolia]